jgi:hypothetical protein
MSTSTWFDESYPPSVLNPPPPVVLPTGATAGTPGAWTPPGCDVPSSLAEANALGLSLGAAWSGLTYVELDPTGSVYWTGTAFALGVAPALDEGTTTSSTRRRKATSSTEEVDDE